MRLNLKIIPNAIRRSGRMTEVALFNENGTPFVPGFILGEENDRTGEVSTNGKVTPADMSKATLVNITVTGTGSGAYIRCSSWPGYAGVFKTLAVGEAAQVEKIFAAGEEYLLDVHAANASQIIERTIG